MGEAVQLTEAQYEALRWIGKNRSTKSEWRTGDRLARGGPETWTHMLMSGPGGSILVAKADLRAILPFIAAGPFNGPDSSIHALNDDGRAVLAKAFPTPRKVPDPTGSER